MPQTKKLLRALQGKPNDVPPLWMMRQAGRYLPEYREIRSKAENFLAFCYTPELAAEVTLQPIRRFGFDAAILFSDILVVPDALGQKVEFVAGEGPKLEPLTSKADIDRLDRGRTKAHLAPVCETVRRVCAALGDDTALIGFAGAPWTVATYMVEGGSSRDYALTKSWAYTKPDEFGALIELLVDVTSEYLIAQIDVGAEAVQLFDSWAGVLATAEFRRWAVAPAAEIVKRVQAAHPGTPVIGFPRGAGLGYEAYVKATGVAGVGLDPTVPVNWAAKTLQPLCAVQGNLDNFLLLAGGAALDRAIDEILENLADGPFIFNLGHGILPETPIAHVEQMIARVRGA